MQGDLTALSEALAGSGFWLILDTVTFHGVSDSQREAMGREVTAIAPDATPILDCLAPRRRGPLPRGSSRENTEAVFPSWEATGVEVADAKPDTLVRLFSFDERFYRLSPE